MYELFDPYHGRTLKIVRYKWQAKLLCKLMPSLDYDNFDPDVNYQNPRPERFVGIKVK